MIVRTPRPDEVSEMVDLGEGMWAESAFAVTEEYDKVASFDFALALLTEHLSNQDGYMQIAKESEDGPIIGMILGQAIPYFFCPSQKMIIDHIVYVREDKRGTSAAYRLVKEFEKWGKSRGALEMAIGVSTGVHPEKTHDFYTRMGYTHTGGIYKKPLNPIQTKEN